MDFQMGMNEVYSPPSEQSPVANIVLVHGLFGGPWKTWAAKDRSSRSRLTSTEGPASSASSMNAQSSYKENPPEHVFWPETLLPSAVGNVRVYSFGYDADVERFMSSAGLNTVHQHGRNLFNELYALRESKIPTIIVAHSLGGLVVKDALNQAAHSAQQDERDVVSNTCGIIFLGTPHKGSSAASYGRGAFMLTKVFAFQSANTKLLMALEKNSETLDRISTDFYQTLETYKDLRIASFSEEKQVRFGALGMQIVRSDSARIGHARKIWGSISEDHRNMAKYATPRDDGFVKVSRIIRAWVDDIKRQMSAIEAKAYEECLNSLNDPVARFRVQEVDRVRHTIKDTFEWLFTDRVPFTRWLSDDGGEYDAIFWITRKPGSGKSTLMRFALEDSRTMSLQPSNSGARPMAYFFHLRGKSLVQKSLRGMLMELLYQILQEHPRSFELLKPIFLNLKRQKQDWDIQSLSEAILHIPLIKPAVPGCKDRITLFVDALDENQKQDENNTLLRIFDRLIANYRELRDRPDAPVIKICLASRPWPIFQQRFQDDPRVPSFAIHNHTRKDIVEFTNSHLLTSRHIPDAYGERQRAISNLSTDIATRAKGVFIWVRVVVDNFRQEIIDGTPVESLHKALHNYPEELDAMYKLTLERVAASYLPETLIIFKVTLASRTSLTIMALYAIAQICMGSPLSENHPTGSSDDMMSWLASRSGGLIHTVEVGEDKPCSMAADGDAEATDLESSSSSSIPTYVEVEFLHSTVEDFVRNMPADGFESVQTNSAVAQLSGSRLLALACLDRHPPHPHLHDVAKDVFNYIRDVEREEDQTQSHQMTCLPHWKRFDLHDFPFSVRASSDPSDDTAPITSYTRYTPAVYRHYLDFNNAVVSMLLSSQTPTRFIADGYNPEYLEPFVLVILYDLYRTRGPQYFSELSADFAKIVRRFLLFIASVGPRLCNDRVDRLRMFRYVLTSYTNDRLTEEATRVPGISLPLKALNKPIKRVCEVSLRVNALNLTSLLVSLEPTTEIDDDALLAFVRGLGAEADMDSTITMKFRGTRRPEIPRTQIKLSMPAFCSRFRDMNRSKWLDLFRDNWNIVPLLSSDGTRLVDDRHPMVVDLAVCQAVSQQPPRHCYTVLAESDGVVAEAIASTCLPAATVGIGGSHMFRAFYRGLNVD